LRTDELLRVHWRTQYGFAGAAYSLQALLKTPVQKAPWGNGRFFAVTAITERSLLRIFSEERNFSNGNGDYGNGRTATEWWKPGVIYHCTGGMNCHDY